ncbi:cytochrome C oxidase subunit IV family protein [Novosphingobium lentum]|uniref:cytochrome C oxidase subunit IV family protein n=1 Tax=Novosphingobium lentum TaxID=145287 RepID=UPI00082DFAA4|nr:cytochrome C oxidase subunit IV family protein [Novosphingobium lentum]
MSALRHPVVLVGLLVAASVLSYGIGHGGISWRWGGVAVLAIAGMKAAIILDQFMEAREEPRGLRVAAYSWLVFVLAVVALPMIAR